MNLIALSAWDLILAAGLVLLLAALSWRLCLGVGRRVLVAALRGTVQLMLVGLVLKQLFAQANPVLIGLLLFGVLAIGLWPRDKGPKAPDGENGVNPGDTGGGKSDGSTRTRPGHAFGRPHHAGAHSNGRRSASVVPPPHSHRAPNTSASGPDHTRTPAP